MFWGENIDLSSPSDKRLNDEQKWESFKGIKKLRQNFEVSHLANGLLESIFVEHVLTVRCLKMMTQQKGRMIKFVTEDSFFFF